MDIHIEAPGHESYGQLQAFYEERLKDVFGKYTFIKKLEAKVVSENKTKRVGLIIWPEKGNSMFVDHSSEDEQTALNKAIRKMHGLIDKYKEKHYHNVHTIDKTQTQSFEPD